MVLSRDCDGCSQLQLCKRRYMKAQVGESVKCPDGTAHLIDSGSVV
jgi:hypothetical protein